MSVDRVLSVDWGDGADRSAAVVVERRADGTLLVVAEKMLGPGTDAVTFEGGRIVERRRGSRLVDVEAEAVGVSLPEKGRP